MPESYIEAGDPYQRHIEECVRLISTEVSNQLSNEATRPAGTVRSLYEELTYRTKKCLIVSIIQSLID